MRPRESEGSRRRTKMTTGKMPTPTIMAVMAKKTIRTCTTKCVSNLRQSMNSLIEITAIEIKELAVIEPKQASEKFELIAKTMSDDQLAVKFSSGPCIQLSA